MSVQIIVGLNMKSIVLAKRHSLWEFTHGHVDNKFDIAVGVVSSWDLTFTHTHTTARVRMSACAVCRNIFTICRNGIAEELVILLDCNILCSSVNVAAGFYNRSSSV